jgi:hypothetical protein
MRGRKGGEAQLDFHPLPYGRPQMPKQRAAAISRRKEVLVAGQRAISVEVSTHTGLGERQRFDIDWLMLLDFKVPKGRVRLTG